MTGSTFDNNKMSSWKYGSAQRKADTLSMYETDSERTTSSFSTTSDVSSQDLSDIMKLKETAECERRGAQCVGGRVIKFPEHMNERQRNDFQNIWKEIIQKEILYVRGLENCLSILSPPAFCFETAFKSHISLIHQAHQKYLNNLAKDISSKDPDHITFNDLCKLFAENLKNLFVNGDNIKKEYIQMLSCYAQSPNFFERTKIETFKTSFNIVMQHLTKYPLHIDRICEMMNDSEKVQFNPIGEAIQFINNNIKSQIGSTWKNLGKQLPKDHQYIILKNDEIKAILESKFRSSKLDIVFNKGDVEYYSYEYVMKTFSNVKENNVIFVKNNYYKAESEFVCDCPIVLRSDHFKKSKV